VPNLRLSPHPPFRCPPFLLPPFLAALAACGASAPEPAGPTTAAGPPLDCPAPIGTIPSENCVEIADDFGALSVSGALKLAGNGPEAQARIDAIRAAGALANAIKEQRLDLCQAYNKCQIPPSDHAAKDKNLADAMAALIKLWDTRQFSRTDQITRFHDQIRALEQRIQTGELAPTAQRASSHRPEDALDQTNTPGLTFKLDAGAITATAETPGPHDALKSRPNILPLLPDRHIRIKIIGTYAPAALPLIQPGEELVAQVKYRADSTGDLYLALRSLEDPDADESISTFHVASGDKGSHATKLTAAPNTTGFYLALGGTAAATIDDIELLRAGKIIAEAHAENPAEPSLQTDCTPTDAQPLAGTKSFKCSAGKGERITLGRPESYLVLSLRDLNGEQAILRTLSLDGGRSIDATLQKAGELVIGLAGKGSATIRTVEVSELPR